jgi:hypothetical protein
MGHCFTFQLRIKILYPPTAFPKHLFQSKLFSISVTVFVSVADDKDDDHVDVVDGEVSQQFFHLLLDQFPLFQLVVEFGIKHSF